jgi:hypothetical protein
MIQRTFVRSLVRLELHDCLNIKTLLTSLARGYTGVRAPYRVIILVSL